MIVRLIVRLRAWLCLIDWTLPLTVEPRGGGPCLDRELEQRIRADERARHTAQADTAHGAGRRIGLYLPDGNSQH